MEVHGEEIFPIQPFRSLAVIFLLKKFYCFLEQDHIDRLKNGKSVRYSRLKPTGGDIFGPRQRYLRTRTEISLDKSGDIRPQIRTMDRQIKCILVIIPPTGNCIIFSLSQFVILNLSFASKNIAFSSVFHRK